MRNPILPDWTGQTVVILAGGPSMNAEAAESLRQFKSIAINFSFRLAPWADILLSLDSDQAFWDEAHIVKGIKLAGGAHPFPDVHYIGQRYETIRLGPCHVIETRNSGLTALRIAVECGAAKIITLGYDHDAIGQHHAGYSDQVKEEPDVYPGLVEGYAAIVAELRAKGIEVERYEPPAKIALGKRAIVKQ